jgi:hypothetical protein
MLEAHDTPHHSQDGFRRGNGGMHGVQEDRIALLLYLSFSVHLIDKHLGVFVSLHSFRQFLSLSLALQFAAITLSSL